MSEKIPVIRPVPARDIGNMQSAAVESGALIMNGQLGILPGSTTTGPPANDRPAQKA